MGDDSDVGLLPSLEEGAEASPPDHDRGYKRSAAVMIAVLAIVGLAGGAGLAMRQRVAANVTVLSPAASKADEIGDFWSLRGLEEQAVSVVYGEMGSDTCPSGYTRITTEAECRAAMPFIKPDPDGYMGKYAESDMPKGCYYYNTNNDNSKGVWFNPHHTGAAHKKAEPVCQKALTVETGRMVFVGDSDIDYWHTSTKEFPGSYNLGIGGATCKDVVKEIDWILNKFKPSRVVLVCGENDISGGTSAAKTFKRWKIIVDKVRGAGARLLGIGTKPEFASKSDHPAHKRYDEKCEEYAVELSKFDVPAPVVAVNSFRAFVDRGNPDSLYDPSEKPDYLHMGESGYALWTRWVKDVLRDELGCVIWKGETCEKQSPNVIVMSAASNACPDGYNKINTEVECREATGLVSLSRNPWHESEDHPDFPAGCYYCGRNVDHCTRGTWFNENADGATWAGARPYCKRIS